MIEDEELLADGIARGLRKHGFATDVTTDGDLGFEKARVNSYDVVVLDRDLPGLHGDEVCKGLRALEHPPRILMLTASGTVADRVEGLTLGADDYMPKPFAFAELVARVTALGRRAPGLPAVIHKHDLEIDVARRSVARAGRPIQLTPREFGVLQTLADAEGAVVSQEQLLEKVWDENADPFTQSVRVIVSRLRRKLGDPPLIQTEFGVGYRL